MVTLRIISWIARLSGLVALLLGLLFWAVDLNLFAAPMVSNPSFIVVHILFGILVTFSLLVLSIALMTTRGGRVLGVVGFVYALIVPIFGEVQLRLHVGGASWLVPTIHLLIGLGAIGLSAVTVRNYSLLKQVPAHSTKESAGVRQAVR